MIALARPAMALWSIGRRREARLRPHVRARGRALPAAASEEVASMCRALIYLGQPVLLDNLLFQPESSLVNQVYMPRELHMLNLAGFGMIAWDGRTHRPERPFRYATTALPVFDRNLKALAEKLTPECVIAHVRGVAYSTAAKVSHLNTHPFCFDGCAVALAHNGDLYRFDEMKRDLLDYVRPEIARHISGSTDSEWIYALILSQLDDPLGSPDGPELLDAVRRSLAIIRDVRARHAIAISSSVNLFIATGQRVLGVRYCFDFGCYRSEGPELVHEANLSYLSLWYTTGRDFGRHEGEWKMIGGEQMADSLIIASEPLTRNQATWLEVPEYSAVYGSLLDNQPTIEVHPLDV
jgi:predicted glutamine amidotransferase